MESKKEFELYNLEGDLKSNRTHEWGEQRALHNLLKPTDCVLELGGNIGCSTIVIDSILRDKSNHVTFEPISHIAATLKKNMELHNCKNSLCEGYLSSTKGKVFRAFGKWDRGLYASRELEVHPHKSFSRKIKSPKKPNLETDALYYPSNFTLEDVSSYVSKPFSFLFADCEGCLPFVMKEYPSLLDNLRCILFERDYHSNHSEDIYTELTNTLEARGFIISPHYNTDIQAWTSTQLK